MTRCAAHSTTFGTTKKSSSRAGALATIFLASPLAVTTSSRIFGFMAITEVIGCDAGDVDLVQLLDETEDGVELAAERFRLRVADRDPREAGDALDGILVDRHRKP